MSILYKQIQQIKIRAKKIGLINSDGDWYYREFLKQNFSVDSCKKLSYNEANRCIKLLGGRAKTVFIEIDDKKLVFSKPTKKQLKMILSIWVNISQDKSEESLLKYINNKSKKRGIRYLSIYYLEKSYASRIIRMLLNMEENIKNQKEAVC